MQGVCTCIHDISLIHMSTMHHSILLLTKLSTDQCELIYHISDAIHNIVSDTLQQSDIYFSVFIINLVAIIRDLPQYGNAPVW